MCTLQLADVKKTPKGAKARAAFVKHAIDEFNAELMNAISTEQALRELRAHADAAGSDTHPLLVAAPNFWRVVGYGLFSASISAVGRIFDRKMGHGLQWYLAVCQSCLDVFSREAIISRSDGQSLDLPGYVAPDKQYFEDLYQATKPCWEYFHSHFLPMRNQWIGHRILATSEAASSLADTFDDAELDKFFGRLAFLHKALRCCFHGEKLSVEVLDQKPKFNDSMHYEVDRMFSLNRLSRSFGH
jgi:hypothetical protein